MNVEDSRIEMKVTHANLLVNFSSRLVQMFASEEKQRMLFVVDYNSKCIKHNAKR